MYNIGDLIIYSAHGLCKIDDICEKTVSGVTRQYYVLRPMENNQQLTISTPVDNPKVVMLDLIQQEEATIVLESFKHPGAKWIEKPNIRHHQYSDIINEGNRLDIASVVNTLTRKKLEAELSDKKLYEQDRKLLDHAQNILFKEIAISLNTSYEEVYETVISFINQETETVSIN